MKSLLRMLVEAKLMQETVGDYIQALIDSLVSVVDLDYTDIQPHTTKTRIQ